MFTEIFPIYIWPYNLTLQIIPYQIDDYEKNIINFGKNLQILEKISLFTEQH